MQKTAYAASGTCNTCSWVIDNNGVLTISPTDGVSGTLKGETRAGLYSGATSWPWYNYRSSIKEVVIQPGVHTHPDGMDYMFYGLNSCTSMNLSELDTSDTHEMFGVFEGCSKLTSLDLSGWDTGNATNMAEMFSGCSGLTSVNVSGWDTGNVTDMKQMFYGCSKLSSVDVSEWDTKNVTTMASMFYNCPQLSSLDVSEWDTGKVTNN